MKTWNRNTIDLKVHNIHFRKLHNTEEQFLKEAGIYKC